MPCSGQVIKNAGAPPTSRGGSPAGKNALLPFPKPVEKMPIFFWRAVRGAAPLAVASVCCAQIERVRRAGGSGLQRSIHLNLRLQLTPYKEVQLIRALSSGRQQWSPNAETPTSGGPGERRMGACVLMGGWGGWGGRAGQSAPEWDALQAVSPEHEFSGPFPSESNESITARHQNSAGRFGRSTAPTHPHPTPPEARPPEKIFQ